MIFPHLQMLKDIDDLVQTDFAFDMDCKQLPNSKPYTQEEAQKMAEIIGQVYLISHSIHCKACGTKYFGAEAFKTQKEDLKK